MDFLEAAIASKGNAFATGGSTTGASAVVATDPAGSDLGQLVALVDRMVQGQQAFQEEISNWQRELVVNNNLTDVSKGLKAVQQVQKGGGLR